MTELSINPLMGEDAIKRMFFDHKDETDVLVRVEPGIYTHKLAAPDRVRWRFEAANPELRATFDAGTASQQACYLPRCPGLVVKNLDFRGGKDNIFVTSASHGMRLENCTFRDVNGSGNNDCIKISETDGIEVIGCKASGPGGAGSGIDAVRCQNGRIVDFVAEGSKPNGPNHGIQIKVESSNWVVENAHVSNFGRGFNCGDTDIQIIDSVTDGCGIGMCFYDANNVFLTKSVIRNPKDYFIAFYATDRAGSLSREHYSNCGINECEFSSDEGFLSGGICWIGDANHASFHQLNLYHIGNTKIDRNGHELLEIGESITIENLLTITAPPLPVPNPEPSPIPVPVPGGMTLVSVPIPDGWEFVNAVLRPKQ